MRARLGSVEIGDGRPVAIIGVINLSPESFHRASVAGSAEEALAMGRKMVGDGACILDIGARATGPGSKPIPRDEEMRRLIAAVRLLAKNLDVPISVDTQFSEIAEAAVNTGAEIVNDVSGLTTDEKIAEVAAKYGCSLILMAARRAPGDVCTIGEILAAWRKSLGVCREAGVRLSRIAVDPAIGAWPARLERLGGGAFERRGGVANIDRIDLTILARLGELRKIGRPICVGISRKSFIGRLLGLYDPRERLAGSLGATVVAVMNGASAVRTHDPKETSHAVRIVEAVQRVEIGR
jgi:dihydropteroate synthase